VERALCLNCGALIPHRPGGRVVMCFRPVTGRPDYVVTIDGAEVHPLYRPCSSCATFAGTTADVGFRGQGIAPRNRCSSSRLGSRPKPLRGEPGRPGSDGGPRRHLYPFLVCALQAEGQRPQGICGYAR
jgi:hypothetical protein